MEKYYYKEKKNGFVVGKIKGFDSVGYPSNFAVNLK